jgi:hypothetical protein
MRRTLLALGLLFSLIAAIQSNKYEKIINHKYLQDALSALPEDKIPDQFKTPRDKLELDI